MLTIYENWSVWLGGFKHDLVRKWKHFWKQEQPWNLTKVNQAIITCVQGFFSAINKKNVMAWPSPWITKTNCANLILREITVELQYVRLRSIAL